MRWIATLALLLLSGCASLGGIGIMPPRFDISDSQQPRLRLLPPSLSNPVGGASLMLYADVENPNPVGITLSRLSGTARIEGFDAADVNFPLGLPLNAGGSTVVPLEISVSFANLPGLADVVGRAVTGGDLAYSLRGTVAVDAGILGQPTFGPMELLAGNVRVQR